MSSWHMQQFLDTCRYFTHFRSLNPQNLFHYEIEQQNENIISKIAMVRCTSLQAHPIYVHLPNSIVCK